MANPYLIRPMAHDDLPLVRGWRAQAHVARWWGDASIEPEDEKLSDPRIALWIAELDGQPFAFIQDYDVHGWSPHPFSYLPAPSRGMDVYIGEAAMIGAGHGARFIRQHVGSLFAAGVKGVGIDPHPDNAAARASFAKAGFKDVRGPVTTPWGVAMLMDRWAGDLAGDVG